MEVSLGVSRATDLFAYDPLLALLWQLLVETTRCAPKGDFRGTSISDFFNNTDVKRTLRIASTEVAVTGYRTFRLAISTEPLLCLRSDKQSGSDYRPSTEYASRTFPGVPPKLPDPEPT
jgi:hypothetical protein